VLIGLAVFALASIAAALAPNRPFLIVCRAVQGIGGSVYPLALALARESVPDDRSTTTISLLTAAFGVGTCVGFVGGGVLAQYLSWRAIFAVGAAVVLLAACGGTGGRERGSVVPVKVESNSAARPTSVCEG
jgi:MFS family permease